jgi:hypothetical protein
VTRLLPPNLAPAVARSLSLALALSTALSVAGCGAAVDPDLRPDDRCLVAIGRPHAIGGPDFQLYKAHVRVPGDDLYAATYDVPAARDLAARGQLDEWLGLGALVLGPVLFLPGVGLLGYGIDRNQDGTIAGGSILTATGLGGIIAGALLYTRAGRERERAIDAYNEQRKEACRP